MWVSGRHSSARYTFHEYTHLSPRAQALSPGASSCWPDILFVIKASLRYHWFGGRVLREEYNNQRNGKILSALTQTSFLKNKEKFKILFFSSLVG